MKRKEDMLGERERERGREREREMREIDGERRTEGAVVLLSRRF